ncbi:MAG TPA: DinB family protein, partial [Burkholderiales bacterium]|nr:DinB family protein [Burkholderiales bacterium]
FQAHLEGREHGYTARNTPEPPALEELWRAQQEVDAWYVAWSESVSEAALDETVRFTFVGGGEGAMTRAQMLLHIVNHTSYHRGFVADLFYQVPARPPVTDLPVFLRDV